MEQPRVGMSTRRPSGSGDKSIRPPSAPSNLEIDIRRGKQKDILAHKSGYSQGAGHETLFPGSTPLHQVA